LRIVAVGLLLADSFGFDLRRIADPHFDTDLYEMGTGALPFQGESTGVIYESILNRAPAAAAGLNPELLGELERIINKALEKDRDLRYQNAAELRADLKRLKRDTESGRSAASGSSTSSSQVPTITKPHKVSVLAGGLTILAVSAAAGFGLYAFLTRNGAEPFRNFTVTQITNTGKAEEAAISPDGKYILNVQNDNGLRSLWLRNILTGSDTQIIAPAPAHYRSLTFSPDGNYVYFRQAINGSTDAYRVPVLGGSSQLIAGTWTATAPFPPITTRSPISVAMTQRQENFSCCQRISMAPMRRFCPSKRCVTWTTMIVLDSRPGRATARK
jgi:eukaryotic-like serine/threonine-protein kinase